jgi:hypothetical protein
VLPNGKLPSTPFFSLLVAALVYLEGSVLVEASKSCSTTAVDANLDADGGNVSIDLVVVAAPFDDDDDDHDDDAMEKALDDGIREDSDSSRVFIVIVQSSSGNSGSRIRLCDILFVLF